jgi:hypothetical protein
MSARSRIVSFAVIIGSSLVSAQTTAPAPVAAIVSIPYADAKPILETLREDLLPVELQDRSPDAVAPIWDRWVSARDAQIRARLQLGDHDSIVNLLLFGVTFTREPRVQARDILAAAAKGRIAEFARSQVIQRRIDDMAAGAAAPGDNERLQFLRRAIEAAGADPRRYLEEGLQRVLAEYDAYARAPTPEQSVRFGDRGLSSDTSLSPGFAIEQALEAIKAERLLGADSVRRVAIVGPGLDFTDKREGYDFYPQQTLQPFAIVDSLIRLGLAARNELQITTLDLNERVNQHLEAARRRARSGDAYVLQLPRHKDAAWTQPLAAYWERFGDRIGEPVRPIAAPLELGDVDVRAVRVPAATVLTITPHDLNIVLQRLEPLADGDRFDLIIATNLLVYYDVFERSLALVNVGKMLRQGGLFLANNSSPVILPPSMDSVGDSETAYSSRLNDRDRIDWYRGR